MKNIPTGNIIHTFAGLRPTPDTHDFILGEDEDVRGFIHVAGIESPGLTAAPAIAEDMAELVVQKLNAVKKDKFIRRREQIVMAHMSLEEKEELVKRDPDFGKLICRCEKISKGEIIDVIRRPAGARDVKGVKRRCRPGMGRCQGGFCEVEVVKILAEELGKELSEITQNGDGSELLVAKAKEAYR